MPTINAPKPGVISDIARTLYFVGLAVCRNTALAASYSRRGSVACILRGLSFLPTQPALLLARVSVRLVRNRRMRVARVIDLLRLDHALNVASAEDATAMFVTRSAGIGVTHTTGLPQLSRERG